MLPLSGVRSLQSVNITSQEVHVSHHIINMPESLGMDWEDVQVPHPLVTLDCLQVFEDFQSRLSHAMMQWETESSSAEAHFVTVS